MAHASVRYIVDDVEAAIGFYAGQFGFEVDMHPGPGFARLTHGSLRLLLNATSGPGGASQPMPDGSKPRPGGWNRIQLEVDDLEELASSLRAAGVSFRGDVVTGRGGKQVLVEDPSGNPIELFEPA